jgi:hypothetical protein
MTGAVFRLQILYVDSSSSVPEMKQELPGGQRKWRKEAGDS